VSWGDYAALSFHGTKVFNTFEGGALVVRSEDARTAVNFGRNFGIANETAIPAVGTNAKMSEFNAALGLVQLRYFDGAVRARERVDRRYREAIAEIGGIEPLPIPRETKPNYSYFPVLVTKEYPMSRDALYEKLKTRGIFTRRYFYPLISNLPRYSVLPSANKQDLPVANRAAERILCLPIYPELGEADQERVMAGLREGAGS
jgi:dTDP-4-amino-4,6-dideoxygalactose transaminase